MSDISLDIHIISRLTHGYYAKSLAELGITMAQFPCIMAVIGNDGISQERLSGILRVGKSTIATVIKQLVDKGLITREVDSGDRRNFRLHATAEAVGLLPGIEASIASCHRMMTAGLDDGERETFCALLAKVRAAAEKSMGVGRAEGV